MGERPSMNNGDGDASPAATVPDIPSQAVRHDSSNQRKHLSTNRVQRWLINRFHAKILAEIVALQPTSFLDAGCGEGFVASMLREALPDLAITGFDVDPAAVEVARQRDPRGTFMTADIFSLPFSDAAFDVVGCFEVLEHLPGDGPRRALRELGRVSNRGLVLSVPHEPFFSLANAARGKNWDIRPRGSDPDHHQLWRQQEFARLVGSEMRLESVSGSLPWTICVARPR